MIHNGLTPDKFVGTHYAISEMAFGCLVTGRSLLPVYDRIALCCHVLENAAYWETESEVEKRRKFYKMTEKDEYRGIHPYQVDKRKFNMRRFPPN